MPLQFLRFLLFLSDMCVSKHKCFTSGLRFVFLSNYFVDYTLSYTLFMYSDCMLLLPQPLCRPLIAWYSFSMCIGVYCSEPCCACKFNWICCSGSDDIVISTSNNHHIKYHVWTEAQGTCYSNSSSSSYSIQFIFCLSLSCFFSLFAHFSVAVGNYRRSFSISEHLAVDLFCNVHGYERDSHWLGEKNNNNVQQQIKIEAPYAKSIWLCMA